MTFYKTRRPHHALDGRTTMVAVKAVTGALGAKAVDMLDNAIALTTQRQQTQPFAA